MSSGDGPKFLGAPPAVPPTKAASPGAAPPPLAPPAPPADDDDDIHQQIIEAFVGQSAQRVQRAQAWVDGPRWRDDGGWRGAWVEQRFGGLVARAPGRWRADDEQRQGVLWDVPGGGFAKLFGFGFEKRAPSVADLVRDLDRAVEQLRARGEDAEKMSHVATRSIAHPHADAPAGAAIEVVSHGIFTEDWPVRWSCYAAWTDKTIMKLELVSPGLPSAELCADFAAVWRGLA